MIKTKILICYLFFTFFSFINLPHHLILQHCYGEQLEDHSHYIEPLASLLFYTIQWEENLKTPTLASEEKILYTNEEIDLLWDKIWRQLHLSVPYEVQKKREYDFQIAYQLYDQTKTYAALGYERQSRESLKSTSNILRRLWEEAVDLEENLSPQLTSPVLLRVRKDPNFYKNPYIPAKAHRQMQPYLLPLEHQMRKVLDHICSNHRVTADKDAFYHAGFITITKRPRSFIHVAKHQSLPGYLVKAYLDTELNEKQGKPSWQWLALRCKGASQISKIIHLRQIKHFVVAKKWIYCFPPQPSPPKDSHHTRHLALLLVTDMNLVSRPNNLHAWRFLISKEHLDELYTIISRAKGSSYRLDNISYSMSGKFAFIDTEYPSKGPDFRSIRRFLNHEMVKYWDKLVKNGGH